jgi:long-subunit fatty acid transport protein
MGGGVALFDPENSLNPAAIWLTQRGTATFSVRQYWRTSENPFGSASGNDTQFPLVMVTGPIGARWDFGVSVSAYTDRTFALTLSDTIDIRGAPVGLNDTLISKGGVNDIQVAVAYTVSRNFSLGLGLHVLTGTNRFEYRRAFSDSSYVPVRVSNELSFSGPGISAGFTAEPIRRVRLAGMARWDGDLAFYKDSTKLSEIPMPLTFAGGIQVAAGDRLTLAGHGLYRNWSVADESIKARGGLGADNAAEAAFGFEWTRNTRAPFKFPIRAGVRYAQLPYPVVDGSKGKEIQLSLGTGFRFTANRGSVDFAIERAWRDDGAAFKEKSFMFTFGVGIRP